MRLWLLIVLIKLKTPTAHKIQSETSKSHFAWPFYYGSGALSFVQSHSALGEGVKGLPIDET